MQRSFGECGSAQAGGEEATAPETQLPSLPFLPLLPPPPLTPELLSIKSQSGARWLRPTWSSPPPPPSSSTQPAGHWRQGPEVTQFYAAPWTSGLGVWQQDGWRKSGLVRELGRCLVSSLLPILTCLWRLKHQSAALVVSLIWLLLACRCRAAAAVPGRSCRASRHTAASYGGPVILSVRGRGSQGAKGHHYGQYCMNLKRPVASRCRGGNKRNQTG